MVITKIQSKTKIDRYLNEIMEIVKKKHSKWFRMVPLNFGSKNEDNQKEIGSQCSKLKRMSEYHLKLLDKFFVTEEKAIPNKLADEMLNHSLKILIDISTIYESRVFKQNFKTTENKTFLTKSDISDLVESILSKFPDVRKSSLVEKEESLILESHLNCQGDTENSRLYSDSSISSNELAKQCPNKAGKGTKRKRGKESEDITEDGSKRSRSAKKNNESGDKAKKSSKKDKIPDVSALDFSNDSKSSSGVSWNFKISSWNINGIRAWLEKNGLSYLHHELPDIMCVQETKCSDDKLPEEVKEIEGYHCYWLSGDKEGYSGVGILSKEKPIKVEYGIGIDEHDNEGRVITAEYEQFYLVSTYVPNAGRGLVRLDYRMKWDEDFRAYLKKLDAQKPVILCGDLNVAHEEIDLANPKTNKKNAGFTKEEREGFSSLLKEGFVDTFRHLYPDMKGAYTFWTYMMNARAKNVGWRLDYFVMSEKFTEKLCDNVIRKDVFGSDHCPVTLFLAL